MTKRNHNFSISLFATLAMFAGLHCTGITAHAQATAQQSGSSVQRLQLDSLEGLAARAKDVIDVELEGALLRMAVNALGKDEADDDPEDRAVKGAARRTLTNLKGVYVKGFEFASAGQFTDANVAPIRSQLRGGGWSRLASVSSRKPDMPTNPDTVEVYAATDPARSETLDGLAVLITGEKKLMVVQITGSLDIAALSGVAGSFNIPQLKNLQMPNAPRGTSAPVAPSAPSRPR